MPWYFGTMDGQQDLSALKNQIATQWSKAMVIDVKAKIKALSIKDKGHLQNKFRRRVIKRYGEVDRITFFYRYYGLFVIQGTGKGSPLKKVKGRNAGLRQRIPKDWYNSIAEEHLPELANQLAEADANAFIKHYPL